MAIDYSDEDFDQDQQQDIAAAAAQAAGINMDSYDFGGFDPGGSDTAGVSNKAAATGILNSYFNDPTKTGMAIRQSFPNFRSPQAGLNQFANLYTSRRGPMNRSDFNSLYDITRSNPGGINTLGYDTAKTLQRYGIGSGQVKTNPNAGRLTGTVFGKKNARGETVLMSGGKSMGIDADKYYGGGSGSDVGRPDLETYQDKYGYADPGQRALNRSYDLYVNPRNSLGLPGYNRDAELKAGEQGQVRQGLRSTAFTDMSGTPTALGPVATYDRDFSGMDNIAMAVTGGIGTLARAMMNPVSGIEGQAIPSAALAPTEEMLARGETSGGMMRSFGEAVGQGVDALGNIGQGFVNAGTNLGDALTNAGVNTVDALTNAGVNIADLFRTDDTPPVGSNLTFTGATSSSLNAPPQYDVNVPPSLAGLDFEDKKAAIEKMISDNKGAIPADLVTYPNSGYAPARSFINSSDNMYGQGMFDLGVTDYDDRTLDEVGASIDNYLNDLEQQQRRSREMDRRRNSGTTFNQLPPNDVFNYFTR